jgi:predicted ATPase
MTDKLSAAMQIAKRLYSLAHEQNDPPMLISAYRALALTSYFMGDFESALQDAIRGIQIWRSGGVQSSVEEATATAVGCLCNKAQCEWHLGEIIACHATIAEAISLAKSLNNMHGIAEALFYAGWVAHYERNPAEVERLISELIELSTRQSFALWLIAGAMLGGWARSASGDPAEGIAWIEEGIRDYRATGGVLTLTNVLGLKAEALYLADRTSEAIEAIKEAEAVAQKTEERFWCAELHRLRGVFLTALDPDETQIEAAFCAAIRIAREQKSISLQKRAEATYAEYRRQKASGSEGRGFRLPLC